MDDDDDDDDDGKIVSIHKHFVVLVSLCLFFSSSLTCFCFLLSLSFLFRLCLCSVLIHLLWFLCFERAQKNSNQQYTNESSKWDWKQNEKNISSLVAFGQSKREPIINSPTTILLLLLLYSTLSFSPALHTHRHMIAGRIFQSGFQDAWSWFSCI